MTAFIEEALREALDRRAASAVVEPYRVQAVGAGGTRPGVDLDDDDALLDVLEPLQENRARG